MKSHKHIDSIALRGLELRHILNKSKLPPRFATCSLPTSRRRAVFFRLDIMLYDRNDYPIWPERDDPPEDHFTFADGVSRAEVNGDAFKALRQENLRRVQSAKHARQSHTA